MGTGTPADAPHSRLSPDNIETLPIDPSYQAGELRTKLRVMTDRSRKVSAPVLRPAPRRKLIEFDPEIWHALQLLSKDSMKTLQELADEAFSDLLRKHGRPVTLRDALRASVRRLPANDEPGQRKGRGR